MIFIGQLYFPLQENGNQSYPPLSCGVLNASDPQRLIYLDAGSVGGRTAWEGLGGMVLFEEVYH